MRIIQYDLIPPHMRDGMQRYIELGEAPGSFLSAILCNDFMTAATRADVMNMNALTNYIQFLHAYAPAACYGSASNFSAWLAHRGLAGAASPQVGGMESAAPRSASRPAVNTGD